MIKRKKFKAVAMLTACMLAVSMLGACSFNGKTDVSNGTAMVDEEAMQRIANKALNQDAITSDDGETLVLADSCVDVKFSNKDVSGEYDNNSATKISLNGTSVNASGSGVSVNGSVATISVAGTYVISGTLSEGQIVVEATDNDKIQIVLDNADISCDKSAAIYVKKADKVFVTLADGSENYLSGGSEYVQSDDNTVDGVVFSKSDLTFNGNGVLSISANYKHGIVSKDTLCITGGTYSVRSVSTCISGKDGIKISDGTFTLNSDNKAIKSENEDDTKLGNIYIAGGTFTIKSEDDAIHAGGSLVVDGGNMTIESGDDGLHAEYDNIINGGSINVTKSYEGLEGKRVTMTGGKVSLISSDDGVNAADPNSSGGFGGFDRGDKGIRPDKSGLDINQMRPERAPMDKNQMPQNGGDSNGNQTQPNGVASQDDQSQSESEVYVKITGGELHVNASGDGLDSNNALIITGGTIYVSGPTNSNNGALDYERTGTISGGTIIAAGANGMAQGFSESSTQCSLQVALSDVKAAGTKIELKDSTGKVLATFTPEKSYSNVVVSTPDLKQGEEYTLVTGETETKLTLSGITTTSGNGGNMGGFGGRGGAQMPNGMKGNR